MSSCHEGDYEKLSNTCSIFSGGLQNLIKIGHQNILQYNNIQLQK